VVVSGHRGLNIYLGILYMLVGLILVGKKKKQQYDFDLAAKFSNRRNFFITLKSFKKNT
jgi:hypothetical protein